MSKKKELVSKIGLRLDGRRADELRRVRCKMGVFSQPDGSAYIEQGLTKVLAAVYGPHQVRGNRSKAQHDSAIVNCQFSMAVFSTSERKKRPRGDRKSSEMSIHLRQALLAAIKVELYPWSQIDIYVEVLHADGGVYPACVNAATLALIDAGIPLKEYVCACSASLANNDIPMVDISHQEEMLGGPTLTIAALPMSEKIVLMEMSQRFHIDHLPKVMAKALKGCKDIKVILDEAVRSHVEDVGCSTGWSNTSQKIKV
ncbi:PREDICTED: exosome complex component RRP41 [Nicrophorus vespilloides]|uniref:Exosome complex component RRP41 n=1 Tax=Nicrophorus vespilloides TaxID=110193 RepID=A0ABM1NB11_NICVS|nr:PREDICTED: exosome complex component RRP41 [Nicrophorus vespilloides]